MLSVYIRTDHFVLFIAVFSVVGDTTVYPTVDDIVLFISHVPSGIQALVGIFSDTGGIYP